MRKVTLAGILVLAILSLCACGNTESQAQNPPEQPSEELTGNVFLDAKEESYSTSGGGISRTITVSKDDALAASPEDYAAFLDHIALSSGRIELYGLIFDDGTGVTYYGCSASNAVYGEITYKGVSVTPYGYIASNDDGTYAYVEYED
ncbi:hypothetical protein [uncultured Dysosmobacter sp.]|uniref:hypothetical protein n=1 Tax=uncultured Dysosmobacter sp. TaxID=2591384 RepID=UPI00260EAEFC|nr:hypothetical protein [uncultured Dysosmobacter sp.]